MLPSRPGVLPRLGRRTDRTSAPLARNHAGRTKIPTNRGSSGGTRAPLGWAFSLRIMSRTIVRSSRLPGTATPRPTISRRQRTRSSNRGPGQCARSPCLPIRLRQTVVDAGEPRTHQPTASTADRHRPPPRDLVTTHYAHPAMPQLDFSDRVASWVVPGGTLFIVAHLDRDDAEGDGHGHAHAQGDGHRDGGDGPPPSASTTAATITARLDPDAWEVVTADESHRTLSGADGHQTTIHDVVVRGTRRR